MKQNLEYLMNPMNIAIIGVSGDTQKASQTGATGLMNNLIKYGFKGGIYPVNPKYNFIMGYKAYPDIQSLPDNVDTIVIGIKRDLVIPIIKESIQKGIKSAVIISAGFAEENSQEGKRLQKELQEIAAEHDFRICGPNCTGIANVHQQAVLSTSAGLWADRLPKGKIGFVSQSGALLSSFLARAGKHGASFSFIVSVGNEADVEIADYIKFMANDPNTEVVAAFIEGLRDGKAFVEAAEACKAAGKELVVFKVGKSERAAKSAQAHTGSLTGSDQVQDALFKKLGIIRVNTVDELLLVSQTLVKWKGQKVGNRLGIVSHSGGAGGVIADLADELGVILADLAPETIEELKKLLPPFAGFVNPIDGTGEILKNPKLYVDVAKTLEKDKNVDMIMFCFTMMPPSIAQVVADIIIEAQHEFEKPAFVCWFSGEVNEPDYKRLLETSFPCFQSFEEMVSVISIIHKKPQYAQKVEIDPKLIGKSSLTEYHDRLRKGQALSEYESKSIVQQFEIPVTKGELALNIEHAIKAAETIEYPVALKIDSPDILHKTEYGCVVLNIPNKEELEKAYNRIIHNAGQLEGARINGVLVQEMVRPSREVIIGVQNDAQFGPVVMFGLGGIFVEVLKDVTFKMAPFSKEEALTMIQEIKSYPILKGVRGQSAVDIDALAETLHKVSIMAACLKDSIEEIDLNPIMVFEEGKGVKAADALLVGKKIESIANGEIAMELSGDLINQR